MCWEEDMACDGSEGGSNTASQAGRQEEKVSSPELQGGLKHYGASILAL